MRQRLGIAGAFIGICFLILIGRLYLLQIVRGDELTNQGQRNFVQRARIQHDRGIVYDRNGHILADNRPSLDVQVTSAFLGRGREGEATLQRLAQLLDLEENVYKTAVKTHRQNKGLELFRSFIVARDLSPDQIDAIETQRALFQLDGVEVVVGRRRFYPYGKVAAHVLGFVNEIDPQALAQERARGNPQRYMAGDATGRFGIERSFESYLRGQDGVEKVVVDAKGRRQEESLVAALLGEKRRIVPVPGDNLYLTIDIELQKAAEAAFFGRSGSAIAMDPNTGEVLAMLSFPAFDPNLVGEKVDVDVKRALDNDPLKPWINRTIAGQYVPGSTFKVVGALAGLNSHVVSAHDNIDCRGTFHMGRHVWRCHKDEGHGHVDLTRSLQVSCDVFYYTVASRMGIEPLAAMGRMLGLGHRTGIELVGEKSGVVPDEAYHDKYDRLSGGYQRGMVINDVIGQGAVLVTPIQLARAYAAIANGGRVLKPQIVHHVETADFRLTRRGLWESGGAIGEDVIGTPASTVRVFEPELVNQMSVPASELRAVLDGLEAVMQPGGTGYSNRSKLVTMGGKTGTAQVVQLGKKRLDVEDMDYFTRDHAWFVGYAPTEHPEIVVTVLNEHSGHGGSQSAPIATAIIDAFFTLKAARLAAAAGDEP